MIDEKNLNSKGYTVRGKYKGHILSDIIIYKMDTEIASIYCDDSEFAKIYGFTEIYPKLWQKIVPLCEISLQNN